jgi:hypothetical protein
MALVDFGPWVTLFVAAVVVAVIGHWHSWRVRQLYPLECPRCGNEFLPTFARATRCCHQCHWPIVSKAMSS